MTTLWPSLAPGSAGFEWPGGHLQKDFEMPATSHRLLERISNLLRESFDPTPVALPDADAAFTNGGFYALQDPVTLTAARVYTFTLEPKKYLRAVILDANNGNNSCTLRINGDDYVFSANETGFLEGVINPAGTFQIFAGSVGRT